MLTRRTIAAVLLFSLAAAAVCAPRVPAPDSEVLERLPFKPGDPVAAELRGLRQRLRAQPDDQQAALALARRYYEMVAEEGDPRYLGYAQAALAPWWNLEEPGDEVRVMRASLLQFGHGFDAAIRDLDVVLARSPRHYNARALRATLHIVQARYPQARSDCSVLRSLGSELVGVACEAMVDGLTGHGQAALAALEAALRAAPDGEPGQKRWALIRIGEISQRLGDLPRAEQAFRAAMAMGMPDTFLLAAYADLLLDSNRWKEVLGLTRDKTASDGLLLRLALAERALKLPSAAARAQALSARYAAARLRGDTVHEQEEARFMLATGGSARDALALAVNNWKLQREPRDARVLMEAAIAARQPAAADPAVEWFERNHVEDRVLARLVQQWKALPR